MYTWGLDDPSRLARAWRLIPDGHRSATDPQLLEPDEEPKYHQMLDDLITYWMPDDVALDSGLEDWSTVTSEQDGTGADFEIDALAESVLRHVARNPTITWDRDALADEDFADPPDVHRAVLSLRDAGLAQVPSGLFQGRPNGLEVTEWGEAWIAQQDEVEA